MAGVSYNYEKITIEVLDMPIARLVFSENDEEYKLEILAEWNASGNREGKLSNECEKIIQEAINNCSAECLESLKDSEQNAKNRKSEIEHE